MIFTRKYYLSFPPLPLVVPPPICIYLLISCARVKRRKVKISRLSYCVLCSFKNFIYLCIVKSIVLLIHYFMERIPLLYKTDEVSKELVLTTRADHKGNVLHCVEFPDVNSPSGMSYAMFMHLSSALDFIKTNFKA